MIRQGPIPLKLHAALEPLVAILLIASPFLFGFSDVGSATAVAIAAGVVMLLVGQMTCWRLSLVKLIPLNVHFMLDMMLGALLIAAPFLFGFSNENGPTAFFLILGVMELLVALGTRFVPEEDLGRSVAANRTAGRTAAERDPSAGGHRVERGRDGGTTQVENTVTTRGGGE